MKKSILFFAAIAVLSLSSCKKEYTCECSTTDLFNVDDDGNAVVTKTTSTIKDTKKNAEESCKSKGSFLFFVNTSCSITE